MKYAKLVGQVKRKMSTKRYLFFVSSIITIIVIVFIFFNNIVNPIILSTSEIKVRSLTLKAVNSAVAEVVSESILYNDLIDVTLNENGDISMITANSILINKLSKELAKTAQAKLEIMGQGGLNIPIGTFTGMPIFVGRGPDVKIKLIPIGSITCTFESNFESAGINQTHHRIYVNIDASVSMILPIENKTVKNRSQVLICESIIIGKVPSTFLHSDNLQDMLDLIP